MVAEAKRQDHSKAKITGDKAKRPAAPELFPDEVPAELRERAQWVVWRWSWDGKKWTKPPFSVHTGKRCDKTDIEAWASFDEALAALRRGGWDGIGYCFAADDPYCGVDLDDARDPATGELAAWAVKILDKLDSYTEVSPTGTGAKVVVRAAKPGARCKKAHGTGDVEIYDHGRFFTLTGARLNDYGGAVEDRQAELTEVYNLVFGADRANGTTNGKATGSTNGKAAGGADPFAGRARGHGRGPSAWADAELLDRMFSAANGADIAALWRGDVRAHKDDHSGGDLALCNHLWFWTGGDRNRVDALFRQSGLMRPKWDERHSGDGRTYGRMTLDVACRGKVYTGDDPLHAPAGDCGPSVPPPPWPDPVPLSAEPAPPPLPVEVFPPATRSYVAEVAAAMNAPADFVAGAVLAAAGAMVGNARVVEVKPGYTASGLLYLALVGKPGAVKTPVLTEVIAPAAEIEQAAYREWRTRKAEYDDAVEQQRRQQRRKDAPPVAAPPRPVLRRLTVGDATVECLAVILRDNPRGVVAVRDELTALVGSMNQYKAGGQGSDKQFYLSNWSNARAVIDRKQTHDERGPVVVDRPFVAVVGNLTPDGLADLRGRRGQAEDDGFLDRFLFAYPAPVPAAGERWAQVSEAARAHWAGVVAALRTLEMEEIDHNPPVRLGVFRVAPRPEGDRDPGRVEHRPVSVPLTACGRKAWEAVTAAQADELNDPEFPDHLRGPWVKLGAYVARLALVLRALRWAEEGGDLDGVDGAAVEAAARLADYFKGMARRTHSALAADPRQALAAKVLRWVLREGLAEFSRRDCYRHFRGDGRVRSPEALDAPLSLLCQHNLIREHPGDDHRRAGRPSLRYEVNPRLAPPGACADEQ